LGVSLRRRVGGEGLSAREKILPLRVLHDPPTVDGECGGKKGLRCQKIFTRKV